MPVPVCVCHMLVAQLIFFLNKCYDSNLLNSCVCVATAKSDLSKKDNTCLWPIFIVSLPNNNWKYNIILVYDKMNNNILRQDLLVFCFFLKYQLDFLINLLSHFLILLTSIAFSCRHSQVCFWLIDLLYIFFSRSYMFAI